MRCIFSLFRVVIKALTNLKLKPKSVIKISQCRMGNEKSFIFFK